uniref:Uncharacterized protein n=1 Tax=Arundo donax TaxID=35708 RepID=A0A0A9DZI7_ARUDO
MFWSRLLHMVGRIYLERKGMLNSFKGGICSLINWRRWSQGCPAWITRRQCTF